jgi:hypothetical protein
MQIRILQASTTTKGATQMNMKFCKKCQCETERYASSGNRCKPCANATSKAYAQANPGKMRASAKAWREANPEKFKAGIAASRAKNPEYKIKARERTAAWIAANPEKHKESRDAWRKANPEKHRASMRAAQKAKAEKFAMYEAFYLANNPKT